MPDRGPLPLGLLALAVGLALTFGVAGLLAGTAFYLRLRNERKRLRWGRLERRWEGPVLAVIGGRAQPHQFWRLVPRRDELFAVHYLRNVGRRLAGEERGVIDRMAAPYLDRVARQLRDRRPEERARAVQSLALLGRQRFGAQLIAALDDPSPLVAMVTARALASRESPDFAVAVLDRLHRFEAWRPSFLASMLAAVGPALGPALIQAQTDRDRDPRTRMVAAEALRELHDLTSADPAVAVLDETTDLELLVAVLGLLADVGRDEHLVAIRRFLQSSHSILRSRAAEVLGQIGAVEDVPALVAALDDPSPWVALRAAEALPKVRAAEALTRAVEAGHARAPLLLAILATRRA